MENNFGVQCCKAKPTSIGSSHDLMYSLCVFQMKEPQNKGDLLPRPEPRPLWGGEDTGTGVRRRVGSGAEQAMLSSDEPLFWAEVLCLQAKLN